MGTLTRQQCEKLTDVVENKSAVRINRDVYCCLYVVYLGGDKRDKGEEFERGTGDIM